LRQARSSPPDYCLYPAIFSLRFIGNWADQVGRYYMSHPEVELGRVVDMDKQLLNFYKQYRNGGDDVITWEQPA